VLGKWLHGPGRPGFSHLTQFTDLIGRHAEFHKEAGHVAKTINDGQYDQALKLIGGGTAFASASNGVVVAIRKLRDASGL
jgi:methyl-accepting chemotaxis protein